MRENESLPPSLVEALLALIGTDDAPGDVVIVVARPDPREQLVDVFEHGLSLGHRFRDVLGSDLGSADAIIRALKADGRVQVTQTVELDPELAPYL